MRRGRKKRKKGYVFTMAALALCLGGMGTVYASWTDRAGEPDRSGNRSISYGSVRKTEPEAWLLDAEGETVEECGAVLTTGDGQNEAEFRIASGILAEMLSLGGSLRLEFPLECGGGRYGSGSRRICAGIGTADGTGTGSVRIRGRDIFTARISGVPF